MNNEPDLIAVLYKKGQTANSLPINALVIDRDSGLLTIYIELITRSISVFNRFTANVRRNRHTEKIVDTDILIANADNMADAKHLRMKPKQKLHEFHQGEIHGWIDGRFGEFEYLLGGSEKEPPPHFLAGMRALVEVPFLDDWATDLWQRGLQIELIVPLLCYRCHAWKLQPIQDSWLALIKELLKEDLTHGNA
jgi:hypothetical protein